MYFDKFMSHKRKFDLFACWWWVMVILAVGSKSHLKKYLVFRAPVHQQAQSNINPLNPHTVKAVGSRAAPWPLTCSRSFPHPQPLSEAHYQPIIVIQWDAACVVACRAHIEKHIKSNTNLQLWMFTHAWRLQCGGLYTLIRLRATDVKTKLCNCLAGQKIWTHIPTFRTLFVINSQIGKKVEIQIRFGLFTQHPSKPTELLSKGKDPICPWYDLMSWFWSCFCFANLLLITFFATTVWIHVHSQ